MVQAGLVLQGYANGSTVVGPGGAHNASRQVASSPFLPSTSNATTLGFNCLVPGSLGLAPSQPPAGPEMTERSTSSSLAFLGAGLQGLSLVSGSLSGGFVSTGPGAGLLGALSSSAGLLDGMTQHHLEAPGGALYGASNVTAKLNGYSTGGGGGRGGSSQPYGPGYGGFSSQQQHSVPPQAVVASAVKVGSKVFVGGLSWETSDQKLRQYFENYGEVLEAFVSYDKNTGRPRGFGFVVFAEPHIADKVVSLQHTIDRREVISPSLRLVVVLPSHCSMALPCFKISVS